MQNIWKENILAVAIILGISIFIFFGALFSNKVLVPVDTLSKEYPWKVIMPQKEDLTRYSLSDATAVFYPWKIFISKELKRGAFPLWCDELGAGYPMSGVSGIYGLSTALLWLFSPQLANNLFHLLEIFLAMLGMFIFLRYMRLLLFPCLVGAISFGLSYPVLEYLSVENIVGALVALPWLFYCLERYYSCGRRYYVALSALIFGMAILNSSIQSMSYILLALLAYFITRVLYEYRVEKVHHLRDHLFVFLAIVALGSALSAVFLIPNLKFFLFDNNRQRFDNISWFAMLVKKPLILTPAVIIGTIFPEFLGNVNTIDFKSAIETIFGKLNFGAVYSSGEWRAYIGVAPLLCAIVAVSKCTKSFYAQLALWVAIFPAAVALFTPLYMFTYLRLLGVTSFGLAILAAIGLDWMMKNRGYDGPLFRRLLIYSMAFLSVVLLFSAVISI